MNIKVNCSLREEERKILNKAKEIVNEIQSELWDKDIDGIDFSDGIQCLSEGFDILKDYLE